ncbi:hypothetical protein Tco_1420933 [Tanacetum coccineum]
MPTTASLSTIETDFSSSVVGKIVALDEALIALSCQCLGVGVVDLYVTTTPSLITTSSSPSPLNAPSKTPSTKDTSSTFSTTFSSFESKPQSSPPTSNDTPYPQPFSLFLDNIMDAPPRPSNPIPLQSHPSLDITLSLSPITPLDHILDTPSPHLPQLPPQPPPMGHPIYFNYHDYLSLFLSQPKSCLFS